MGQSRDRQLSWRGALMRTAAIVVLAAPAWLPSHAAAAPLTFSYTGHIVGIGSLGEPDPSPFPDPIDDGTNGPPTPFSGTYTFESTTLDAIPGDPTSGSYPDPVGTFTLQLGGLSFTFTGVSIGINNFPGFDFYGAAHDDDTVGTPTGEHVQINLQGLSDSALSSDALPLTPPNLALFDTTNAFFFTDTINGSQVDLNGAIDTLTASTTPTVPEPGSLLLLAIGSFALGIRRRR